MQETAKPWFGEWVKSQRAHVYGWTQEECAARVQVYYTANAADLPPDERQTSFSRMSWSKIESNRKWRRVREKTVFHVSLGLLLPLSTCMAMAGYVAEPPGTDISHTIGRNLYSFRQRNCLTLDHCARMVGVSLDRYKSWEGGTTVPDAQQMYQLSYLFEAPIEALYGTPEREPATLPVLSKRQIEAATSILKRLLSAEPETASGRQRPRELLRA